MRALDSERMHRGPTGMSEAQGYEAIKTHDQKSDLFTIVSSSCRAARGELSGLLPGIAGAAPGRFTPVEISESTSPRYSPLRDSQLFCAAYFKALPARRSRKPRSRSTSIIAPARASTLPDGKK